MKISLHWRQPKEILVQSTEIYLHYKDINALIELIENYPTKDILIIFNENSDIDWNFLKACAGKIHISCECADLDQMLQCRHNGLKFHWSQSIQSFYELNQLIEFGIDSAYLGPELFFNYEKVKNKIQTRIIPNVVNNGGFKVDSGLCGTWVRPEDIEYYYDAIISFYTNTDDSKLIQERTLFLVYNQGKWLGNLNQIIQNIGVNCNNAVIDDRFGEKRLDCNNICQKNKYCHLCDKIIKLAQTIKPS